MDTWSADPRFCATRLQPSPLYWTRVGNRTEPHFCPYCVQEIQGAPLPLHQTRHLAVSYAKLLPVLQRKDSYLDKVISRIERRPWPIGASIVFVALGCAYVFRWGPVGQHVPSLWISPNDLWSSYLSASRLAHGHFGSIYGSSMDFVDFPGILVVLAPLVR